MLKDGVNHKEDAIEQALPALAFVLNRLENLAWDIARLMPVEDDPKHHNAIDLVQRAYEETRRAAHALDGTTTPDTLPIWVKAKPELFRKCFGVGGIGPPFLTPRTNNTERNKDSHA